MKNEMLKESITEINFKLLKAIRIKNIETKKEPSWVMARRVCTCAAFAIKGANVKVYDRDVNRMSGCKGATTGSGM